LRRVRRRGRRRILPSIPPLVIKSIGVMLQITGAW